MGKITPKTVSTTPTPWQEVVLVCRKCSKKLGGGFGEDGAETLSRGLKLALRRDGQRQAVRVVECKCLGLCPRGAVTMLRSSQPGTLLAVPAGTDPAALLGGSTPGG